MLDIHLIENGGAIVGGCYFAVWRDHDLVHSVGPEGRSQSRADGLGSQNVRLDCLDTCHSILLCLRAIYLKNMKSKTNLISHNKEGSSILIDCDSDISWKLWHTTGAHGHLHTWLHHFLKIKLFSSLKK
jgi:hypothetical protein